MVSVIIPVYNEEKTVTNCLTSLKLQNYKPLEIIIVDDGSTDESKVKSLPAQAGQKSKVQLKIKNLKILSQPHLGPGAARNLGAKYAKGEILVFVDADMTFAKDFIAQLVKPIEKKEVIGTFSKEEYLLNKDNLWAICWNINRYVINGWKLDGHVYERILPTYYPNHQPVFRAILKKEFDRVGGFDNIGYTDDWTLSRKLNIEAQVVPGAVFYHRNPQTLTEIFKQARWIGKNEFLSGSFLRRIFNLFRYCLPNSLLLGIIVSTKLKRPQFLLFKIVYDLGVWLSIFNSFFDPSIIK